MDSGMRTIGFDWKFLSDEWPEGTIVQIFWL